MLADAFSEFISAAGRLEASYGELQEQVAQLGHELAERNAALNASLEENERIRLALQQIVDALPCGVLVIERDGRLAMINPEGLRLLGLASEFGAGATLTEISAASGIDLTTLAGDERAPEGEQELSVASHAGRRWIVVGNRRLYTDQLPGAREAAAGTAMGSREDGHAGSPGPHLSTVGAEHKGICADAHRDVAMEPVGRGTSRLWRQTILIVRDATTQKRAELERERGRRATALAEIAAMLAHEIRNPLASLELFAGLIAGSESVASSGGPELEWISHMQAGIRSLSGTVNNVLSFHGVGFPSLAPLDLAEAVGSSVAFVRPIAAQSGVNLYLDLRATGVRVMANAGGLQQLLLNLISNAVRHTPQGGSVHVGLAMQGKCDSAVRPNITLSVADTGSGIRTEHLTEIFRAGFSGSGNTSGLGLAVCSQIVRQHEGEIRVTSRLGSGSTFLVELPTL